MGLVVGVTFVAGVAMVASGLIFVVGALVDGDDSGAAQVLFGLVAVAVGLCAICCAMELGDRLRAEAIAARRSDAIQEGR